MSESLILFDQEFYKQHDGVAMGSPLWPTLASVFLYFFCYLNGEEIKGSFYEKELQKTDQKEFRIEKVIEKKGDKLYVKWKGYDN